MGKYRALGSLFDRVFRNDLNKNFDDIDTDIKGIKNDFDSVVDTVSNKAYAQVVDAARLNWKDPVDSFVNLPVDATAGDTRMARDTGKVYRYDEGNWNEIQQIDAGPVNEVDSRLSAQLADIVYNINQFGTFGTVNDNANFIAACDYVSARNGTLLIRDKTINLSSVVVNELPNIISVNSTINLSGGCIWSRTNDNLYLEDLNIVSSNAFTTILLTVTGVTGALIKNFKFNYQRVDANRCEQVLRFVETTGITILNPEFTGVNFGIVVRDANTNAVSKDIKIINPIIRDFKTGIYLSAVNTVYNADNFIKNVVITNPIGINTKAQSESYTGVLQGANLIMFERVKDIEIDTITCEFPIERVAYFNIVENLKIGRVIGRNTEGVKIAGTPTQLSKNNIIGEINIVNSEKAGYAYRSYFAENTDIFKIDINNSQMLTKPDNAISLSVYIKQLKIRNLFIDGLNSSPVIMRIDDFGSTIGYAYQAFTPILDGIQIINAQIRNVCLVNASNAIIDLQFTLSANNPTFIADPNILTDKTILTNLVLENVNIDPRASYQGKIASFKNTTGLKINCKIRQYRALYSYRFMSFDDAVSQNASKTIQVEIYSPDYPSAFPSSHSDVFINADSNSRITIYYKNNIIYRIFNNTRSKIMAELNIQSELFKNYASDTAFLFAAWSYAAGETYVLKYSDEIEDAIATIDGSGIVTITKPSANFTNANIDGKICLYSQSGTIRLINRLATDKLASVKFIRNVI